MPNQVTNRIPENVQKALKAPYGDDGIMFYCGVKIMMPEYANEMMEAHNDSTNSAYGDRLEYMVEQVNVPWVITYKYRAEVFDDNVDQTAVLKDFKKAEQEVEKEFWKHIRPGDEEIVEYADATVFNPARRALNGWPCFRLNERLNLNAWQKEILAYGNLDLGDKGRRQMAYCDAYFPFPRMCINADKAIQTHLDYFEEVEKGTLTADKEAAYRQRLLEQEVAIHQTLQRTAGIMDPVEGERIKELTGIGNPADNFHRYAARGIKSLTADTEARIAGLKTGWPIEDLNALSSFKYSLDAVYMRAYYSSAETTPKLRDIPVFQPGEQEYLTKMQELWARIESTPVKSNETRKALLTEMRALIAEGLEKEFVPTVQLEDDGEPFSYVLYDIDRKLARELTPTEQEVMEHHEPYDRAAYENAVQMESDQARIRRERYEQEQEKLRELRENTEQLKNDRQKAKEQEEQRKNLEEARQREELEARAVAGREEAPNPDYYEDVRDVQRRRRNRELTAQEREQRRLDPREAGNNFFFESTREQREKAAKRAPINPLTRMISVENDLLRYYMGKNNQYYDGVLDMKLLSPEERLKKAQDYYEDLENHPFVGVPEPEAVKNARYFGDLDAKAAKNLIAETLPEIDLGDPEQVANFSNSKLGILGTFTMDFTQDDACFRDAYHLSSSLRPAYVSAFGTREKYAATIGQLSVCNTLSEIARIVNMPGIPPLERAVALHFLQKSYDEIKGKPLSALPADQWIRLRAIASGLWSLRDDGKYPTQGAPSPEAIENFLAGGADPFSEDYLRKFDPAISRMLDRQVTEPNRKAVDHLTRGNIDMARIYNLEYIRQNGNQRRLEYEDLTGMSPELKEKTHRIFDQTLGNLISVTGMQSVLCAAKNESVFDRFRVNGHKISDMMDDFYGKDRLALMNPEDREIATEALLMQAITDPDHKLTFVPVHYGPDGSIVEGEAVSVPRPDPQRVAANPVQPPNDALLFENAVSQAAEQAEKLDSVVPGAYPVYEQGHLERRLAEPQAMSPEGSRAAKQAFLLEYAQASRELAGRIGGQKPQIAAYLRLQANIATRSLAEPMPRNAFPYASLMGLVDQIHLPVQDAIDERRPGPVFRLIADEPDGFNPFPVMEAAQSAERLMEMGREHVAKLQNAGQNVSPEEDIRVRKEMLREITALEGHLDEMERVAGLRKRGRQLSEAFDDPRAVELFLAGKPGLAVMRAELQGRRQAIVNGWPAEDIDLIAGFYAKREAVRQAIRSLPEGSENRLAYERAGMVLDEICTMIDHRVAPDAASRQEFYNAVDAYGPALYNDLVSRAGAPEAGQTQALKSAVTQAKNAQISPAAFRTNEQCQDLNSAANEQKTKALRDAADNETKRRARVRKQREEAKKQREEDAAIGEALEEGLFGEEPEQGDRRGNVEDWLDADLVEEYNDELIDQVLDAGVNEEDMLDLEGQPFMGENPDDVYAGTDFDGQTFDQLFFTPEQREISSFYPDDPYIRMISEDENFFGNLFDEVKGSEAGYELHGHNGRYGFFEWSDIKERLFNVAKGPASDLMLKKDRLGSLTNLFRSYLMAKHQIPFEEAYRFNEGDMVTRRKEASAFLDELEAYPLNPDMSQSAREESAAYYGWMHKEALDNFRRSEFQEMDLSSMEAIKRLFYGPSMTQAVSRFALDFAQDTEPLYLSSDPAVRTAYQDAFGGREAQNMARENLSFAQSIGYLIQTAAEPENPQKPLRNRAFAKYQLELVNAQMKGKKYGDAPVGLADHLSYLGSELGSVALPAQGAPTEQQLRDYLDGKIASPFTEAYIEAANRQMNESIAAGMRDTVQVSVVKQLTKGLPNATSVYSLPYIPVGPDAARPQPDYYTISEGLLHDTHVTFTGIIDRHLLGDAVMQLRLTARKGETMTDRFRINGRKVSEMPGVADLKGVKTPEDYQRILEAEILQALADPKKTLSYVPLTVDANGDTVEMDPVTLAKPAPLAFQKKAYTPDPALATNDLTKEIVKYTTALVPLPLGLTVTKGLRPGDDRLDSDVQYRYFSENPMLYANEEEDEGEMEVPKGKYLPFNHREGALSGYRLIHGIMADGTLSEEGRKNYQDFKAYLNTEYDAVTGIAAEYDAKSPMLAEMMRLTADMTTTYERGIPWSDLKNTYAYQIINGTQAALHLGPYNVKAPCDQEEAMRIYTGYPYGDPKFTAPQAISAVRRMAITEGLHSRSVAEGTLSRAQDRLNRRMALAELEEAKKQLQQINKFYLSAYDENGQIDVTKPGAAQVAHIDRFMEESVYNTTSYYPRGTKEAQVDLDNQHLLISRGWPMEDVNLMAWLLTRRYQLRALLADPGKLKDKEPEQIAAYRRSLKVLNEVCAVLEQKEITSAQDRQEVLAHLEGYGDLLFNGDVLRVEDSAHDFSARFKAAKERTLQPHEFLSAEELKEFRDKDAVYQAQKDSLDIVPTMNGPQTDEERAFLNAELLAGLMVVQGRMEADQAAYARDPALTEAWRQINLFANRTNAFYRNHELLDPENAEKRRNAFEELKNASTDLVDALDEAEDRLTQGGEKTKFTPAEEKLLKDIRQAKHAIGEMRRRYIAQMDYEDRRQKDMIAEEARRAEEREAREREMEALSFDETAHLEGAEREEAERDMVDLDYAMSMLPEEEQRILEERLEMLTRIPGTERFDFATGQELPPRHRPLPERIRMTYDADGNLRPAILLMTKEELELRRQQEMYPGLEPVEVRLAKEEAQAQREAIRESRRQERERRQAGASPYDEGAADFFAMVDEDIRLRDGVAETERQQAIREQFIRDREREAEGDRRKARAQETGDERYNWSFAHILDDAYEKLEAANTAQKEAQNDPIAAARKAAGAQRDAVEDLKDAVKNVETTTKEHNKCARIYSGMERAVMASLDADALDQVLERVRPEWYHKTYLPQLESLLSSASPAERYRVGARSGLGRSIIQALPDKERHDILGAIANELPLQRREQLREELLSLDAPMERAYEDQVYQPLHARVDELKRNVETVVDAEGNPLAPEVREAYEDALAYADETLDEITQETYENATGLSRDLEIARRTIRREQTREDLAGRDPEYLIVESQIMHTDERIVSQGVMPSHRQALDQILHPVNNYSREYLQHLGHMLTRMEEMGMKPAQDGEQGEKLYACEDVAEAKGAFADAVRSGDYARIIETKRVYEEKRNNMKELMDYAKEHFSGTSAPGNVDSARNKGVPWEYSREAITNSQVNGVFQLYSILKRTGISVQDFVADPYAARRRIGEKLDEERSYGKLMKGKPIGAFLGTLMAETKMEASNRTTMAGMDDMIIGRATDALVECNPDLTVQGQNRHTDWILNNHRSIVTKVRESDRNPFTLGDTRRAGEVQQLLSVVLPEDLEKDSERMLCGVCYDAEGRKLPAVTAQQYIASKAEFDYTKIRERSADIIRDALSVENTRFDAAAFLEERQKALSMLLTARADEAGRPGFDALEYELTHMDEVYDQLRASNRKDMPELSPEQRQRFKDIAGQYERTRKQIRDGLTRQQKNAIALRRRNAGDTVNSSRMAMIRHEVRRNEAEDKERTIRETREREEQARRRQEENNRRVEERRRQQQEERENERQAAELRTRVSEQRVARHAVLPLTERFLQRIDAYIESDRKKQEAAQATGAGAAEKRYEAGKQHLSVEDRADRILKSLAAACLGEPESIESYLPPERTKLLLTEELGAQRASVIAAKLPRGIRNIGDLAELSREERALVVGALTGAASTAEQTRILTQDDAFVPYEDKQLKGSPYETEEVRVEFEKQLQPLSPMNRQIRDLKAEIYNDWHKFTNGTGTKKQRAELAAALDYAEQMFRQVDDREKRLVHDGRELLEGYYNEKAKESIADQLRMENNLHLKDLREDPQNLGFMSVPRADRGQEIRDLKNEKMVFQAGYIEHVTQMLRKMEQMELLSADRGREEKSKVYAFHKLMRAQNDLQKAIEAKNREAILGAVAELKAVRRDMDELMRIAQENFHPGENMDNLDLVRNSNIPWDYARDAVTSSQVNSIFLFGNALKDCGISIDEFAADPGAAIQKMERLTQERYNSVKGFAQGRSLGTLAADAGTGYMEGQVSYPCVDANGRFMRAVGGLIYADPGASKVQRERNRLLLNRIHDQNSENQLAHQHLTLKPLKEAISGRNATEQERDTLRTLMVAEEQDIDPDRMFTIPPIAADGTRMEDFSLSVYLSTKGSFNYQAQTSRLETMLRDASKEVADLRSRIAEDKRLHINNAALRGSHPDSFRPYAMLKARQDALIELLTLRRQEKGQPGYQALERELHELPERYERLRKAEPDLQLPELTKAQKNELKAGAKTYDDLTKNREKLMDAEEKRINSVEAANDREFNRTLREAGEEYNRKAAEYNDLLERAASDQRRNDAKRGYEAQLVRINVLKRERARQLVDDYLSGKLPERYTVKKLQELKQMEGLVFQDAGTIPVFGEKHADARRENARLRDREKFLSFNILENKGFTIRKGHTTIPDSMLQLVQDLKVPLAADEIKPDRPVAEGREAQMEALLEDGPALGGQDQHAPSIHQDEIAPALGENVNQIADQEAERAIEEIDGMDEEPEPEREVNRPMQNGQPEVPAGPGVPPQEQPGPQPEPQPGVHDKTFEDLEKKILGGKPEPEVHKRSNSVRIPAGQLKGNEPANGEQRQNGPRVGG